MKLRLMALSILYKHPTTELHSHPKRSYRLEMPWNESRNLKRKGPRKETRGSTMKSKRNSFYKSHNSASVLKRTSLNFLISPTLGRNTEMHGSFHSLTFYVSTVSLPTFKGLLLWFLTAISAKMSRSWHSHIDVQSTVYPSYDTCMVIWSQVLQKGYQLLSFISGWISRISLKKHWLF